MSFSLYNHKQIQVFYKADISNNKKKERRNNIKEWNRIEKNRIIMLNKKLHNITRPL